MTERLYHYSLIRAVPDPRRGEWVNVGICVYLDGRLDVRVLPGMGKVRALDPTARDGLLAGVAERWNTLCEGIASAEQRQALLARNVALHASPLAWFRPDDSADYEAEVDAIMRTLVIPPARPRPPAEPRIHTRLRRVLHHAGLFSADADGIHRHKVVEHYPIDREAGLVASFAARNGVLHVAETLDLQFPRDRARERHGAAAACAITIDTARQREKDMRGVVVYAATAENEVTHAQALTLVHKHAHRAFNIRDRRALSDYVTELADTLGASVTPRTSPAPRTPPA